MIINKLPDDQVSEYVKIIKGVCTLSKLFSESDKPYIDYRATENIFCRCFEAENLSRSDVAFDAKLRGYGIGIKTFVETGKGKAAPQKIAEFNRESVRYRHLEDDQIVIHISELRNKRIDFASRAYLTEENCYHCLVRGIGEICITESPLETIDIEKIQIQSPGKNKTTIKFTDGLNEYVFNKSKSTLYKIFDCSDHLLNINVSVIEDPFVLLKNAPSLFRDSAQAEPEKPKIVLSLYSEKRGQKFVPVKSGLNQWNARGRRRDPDEVYIPVPKHIHYKNPGFFPPKNVKFLLRLPDRERYLNAKLCQAGDKALMSNPNSALGEWILRDVLRIPPGELVTYEDLEAVGIDSVEVTKDREGYYSIDFVQSDNRNYLY